MQPITEVFFRWRVQLLKKGRELVPEIKQFSLRELRVDLEKKMRSSEWKRGGSI